MATLAAMKEFYLALWCSLRRIEIGTHETGGEMTRDDMIRLARFALTYSPVPNKIPEGYER